MPTKFEHAQTIGSHLKLFFSENSGANWQSKITHNIDLHINVLDQVN
jgi:hypothetical protein